MTHGLTDNGRKAFAKALREYRKKKQLTQAAFAEWLTEETGIHVKEHNITVLEAEKWANKFDLNILFAVHNAQIIRHPNGTPYTFNDLMQMLQAAELVTV
jgi:DNA-binding XRE family transcriptional regulator